MRRQSSRQNRYPATVSLHVRSPLTPVGKPRYHRVPSSVEGPYVLMVASSHSYTVMISRLALQNLQVATLTLSFAGYNNRHVARDPMVPFKAARYHPNHPDSELVRATCVCSVVVATVQTNANHVGQAVPVTQPF